MRDGKDMDPQLPIDPADELLEARLREMASALTYPPTPDIAGAVQKRLVQGRRGIARGAPRSRLALAGLVLSLAIVFVGLLTVPEVQAFVRQILRIGAIEIVVGTPTPGSSPTLVPTWSPNLVGETSLAEAQDRVTFPLKLPTYPADLGLPHRVYLQHIDGAMVIMAWTQPDDPDKPRMALYQLTSDIIGRKTLDESTIIQETTVNGQRALWLRGPHMVEFYDQGGRTMEPRRLVDGNVLAWTDGRVTYRLESTLSLEEAVRVAESLREHSEPFPTPTASSVLQLAGETTLEDARKQVSHTILLPAYPHDLGEPHKVFVQDVGSTMVVLVWLEPGSRDRVRLSLHQITGIEPRASKEVGEPKVLQQTTVSGLAAAWVTGPHMLRFHGGNGREIDKTARLVTGNTLVWNDPWMTYRLESNLSLEETVRVAESLR